MENLDIEKYKNYLLSDNPSNRDVAINVFYHCGIFDDEIDNNIITLLKTDNSQEIRRTIIHMISDRVDKKFMDTLFETLKDDDYVVRGNAYLGLLKLGISRNHKQLDDYRKKAIHDYERFCIRNS